MGDETVGGGDEIVRFAHQQRAAVAGEPTCVICGRYGEYVCDATDDDVCSLECRDVCTQRHTDDAITNKRKLPSIVEAIDDCIEQIPSPPTKRTRNDDTDAADAAKQARQRLHIQVETVGGAASDPLPLLCSSFDSLPVQLKANLVAKGFDSPTPVQMQTIPAILMDMHVLVSAPTGTGKTAAFLVPVITQILETRSDSESMSRDGPCAALVLAPVRELAMQIEDEAKSLMKGIHNMKTALLVGGLPVPPQLHRLRQVVQLVVATPGRLLGILTDYCEDAVVERLLDSVRCCIVDEVDMMLSIGFRDTIAQILGLLVASTQSAGVQLVFTSATISTEVEAVVASYVAPSSYVRIRIGDPVTRADPKAAAAASGLTVHAHVTHAVRWVEENAKKTELFRFIQSHPAQSTLVFVDSRVGADMLASAIQQTTTGARAGSFHAGKSQRERLQILEEFIEERVQVLVSTNVLGRGIDMLSVENVVIFDAPKTIQDYVHLVGRAGRSGVAEETTREEKHAHTQATATATSTLYVNAKDAAIFDDLVQLFRSTSRVRIPEQVYSELRVRFTRQQCHEKQRQVAMDDAKRAFRVLEDINGQSLSHQARAWGTWKYKAKSSHLK